jgi:hypothetical protein
MYGGYAPRGAPGIRLSQYWQGALYNKRASFPSALPRPPNDNARTLDCRGRICRTVHLPHEKAPNGVMQRCSCFFGGDGLTELQHNIMKIKAQN